MDAEILQSAAETCHVFILFWWSNSTIRTCVFGWCIASKTTILGSLKDTFVHQPTIISGLHPLCCSLNRKFVVGWELVDGQKASTDRNLRDMVVASWRSGPRTTIPMFNPIYLLSQTSFQLNPIKILLWNPNNPLSQTVGSLRPNHVHTSNPSNRSKNQQSHQPLVSLRTLRSAQCPSCWLPGRRKIMWDTSQHSTTLRKLQYFTHLNSEFGHEIWGWFPLYVCSHDSQSVTVREVVNI